MWVDGTRYTVGPRNTTNGVTMVLLSDDNWGTRVVSPNTPTDGWEA